MIYHAIGGGTGSGFATKLTEHLSSDYETKVKTSCTVWPSPKMSTSVVEDYNTLLVSYRMLTDIMDMSILVDNE